MVSTVLATPMPTHRRFGVCFVPRRPPTHEADVDAESLGGVIRRARLAMGEDQTSFGLAIGLNQSQVSQIETNKHMPQIHTLQAISAHTGVAAGTLLRLAKWPGAFTGVVSVGLAKAVEPLDDRLQRVVQSFAVHLGGQNLSDVELTERVRIFAEYLREHGIPEDDGEARSEN